MTLIHWELNKVFYACGQEKDYGLIFLERKSRQYIAIKMSYRPTSSMEQVNQEAPSPIA